MFEAPPCPKFIEQCGRFWSWRGAGASSCTGPGCTITTSGYDFRKGQAILKVHAAPVGTPWLCLSTGAHAPVAFRARRTVYLIFLDSLPPPLPHAFPAHG